MATIVNTTEEEPMLAVVRFTAELAWADAGPDVAEPEVTHLCMEAQQHILTGRWLDMASLMLASADLLSPRVPDKDLECILAIICSLVTKAGSEDEALQIAELICAKLTQQPDDKPTLRLKILFSLYNLLASPYGKAFVYRKALELATAGKAADCIIPTFKNIDSFVADWGIGNLEQRELFLAVARILKDQKGMSKEYFNFLNKYLATFKGAGDDADAIGDAKEHTVAEEDGDEEGSRGRRGRGRGGGDTTGVHAAADGDGGAVDGGGGGARGRAPRPRGGVADRHGRARRGAARARPPVARARGRVAGARRGARGSPPPARRRPARQARRRHILIHPYTHPPDDPSPRSARRAAD